MPHVVVQVKLPLDVVSMQRLSPGHAVTERLVQDDKHKPLYHTHSELTAQVAWLAIFEQSPWHDDVAVLYVHPVVCAHTDWTVWFDVAKRYLHAG